MTLTSPNCYACQTANFTIPRLPGDAYLRSHAFSKGLEVLTVNLLMNL